MVHSWRQIVREVNAEPSLIATALRNGAEGVGLYRTEYPFLLRDAFLVESEQFEIYRELLESFAPQPVTLRTLDVGSDKLLPYFPVEEDNPFLAVADPVLAR